MVLNLSNSLNAQARTVVALSNTKSIKELIVGKKYDIYSFSEIDTRFGKTLKAVVRKQEEEDVEMAEDFFSIYLTKWVKISEEEIKKFNEGPQQLSIIYHGMVNKSFNISFQ